MIGEKIDGSLFEFYVNNNPKNCTLGQKVRYGIEDSYLEVTYCYDINKEGTDIVPRVERTEPPFIYADNESSAKLKNFDYYDEELMKELWAWETNEQRTINIVTRVGEVTMSTPFKVTIVESRYIDRRDI